MVKNFALLFFLLIEIQGFELDFLVHVAKTCLPKEHFRGFHFILSPSFFSDEEIYSLTELYQKTSYIGCSSR